MERMSGTSSLYAVPVNIFYNRFRFCVQVLFVFIAKAFKSVASSEGGLPDKTQKKVKK